MKPSSVLFASALASALLTCTLHAHQNEPPQSEEPEDQERQAPQATVAEQIIVSAKLQQARRETVGSSITVIDRQEIESRGKVTVLELLRTVPGLEVLQGGGQGRLASVLIRGGNSSHTLVLVDGMRVNNVNTGAFDLADLKVDNIERIEILRGPQSTLYGSEAVGGVISIMTRSGREDLRVTARGEMGSRDLAHVKLGVEGGGPATFYSFTAAELSTDGVSAASEKAGNTEDDPWDNFTFSGRVGWRFHEDGRADLSLRYVDGETGLDGFTFGVGPTDDLNALQNRHLLQTAVKVQKELGRRWRQSFRLGLTDDDLIGSDEDTPFNNFSFSSEVVELTALTDVVLSQADTLTLGYTVERRAGEFRSAFDETVYVRSVYLENRWSWAQRLHLTAGLRNDDHSSFGGETTYRITGSYLLPDMAVRLHGSVGTGFRAPTLNDLFFPGFSNPELEPETSRGFDLGIEKELLDQKLRLDVTYFDNEFEDLILFDPLERRPRNIARAEAAGFEIEIRFRPESQLELGASHTWTDSEDPATGSPLPRRPEERSTVHLRFEGRRRVGGSLSVVSVRDRFDSDGRRMDDYERVDLSLTYRWRDAWRPYLRIENLLDQDYQEIPGFTTPGFTAVVGLEVGSR